MLHLVTISSSRGSSEPRDRTRDFCIGRQILYHCANGEVQATEPPYELVENCREDLACLSCYRKEVRDVRTHRESSVQTAVQKPAPLWPGG